ncbi:hypothetical protein G6F56_010017 [Rhizopus delemar]|uniref:Extracellular membrane protein CFEM domain-containing protein n=1 Tax=Rhizopus stolonifer TaxID=4846 RepID=A0A367JW32_RHIST|nr:hypothetical protein G6F56_010017 [Rhizopus delemar]RCH94069.1 hypothetical protein CU098_010384 [Rhizopus stolonifer]
MHSLILTTLVATLAAAVSAQNCNPTYNTPSAGPCFANCNEEAGKTFYSDWTSDSSSQNFLKSLTIMCNKGTSEYMAFMTKAGMCMVSCANPDLFNQEFASACAWWQLHKSDACDATSVTTAEVTTNTMTATITTSSSSAVTPSSSSTVTPSSSSIVDTPSSSTAVTTSIQSESTSTSNSATTANVMTASSGVISVPVTTASASDLNVTSVVSSAGSVSSDSHAPSASQSNTTSSQTPNAANNLKTGSIAVIAFVAVTYLTI